jgi:hypothetical protein
MVLGFRDVLQTKGCYRAPSAAVVPMRFTKLVEILRQHFFHGRQFVEVNCGALQLADQRLCHQVLWKQMIVERAARQASRLHHLTDADSRKSALAEQTNRFIENRFLFLCCSTTVVYPIGPPET